MKKKIISICIGISIISTFSMCNSVYAGFTGEALDGLLPERETSKNQLKKMEVYTVADGEETYDDCYEYDYDNGKISTITNLDNLGNKKNIKTYTYNDDDQIILNEYEDLENPEKSSTSKYVYDQNGMLTENNQYDMQNNLEYQRTYTFDSDGNLTDDSIYDTEEKSTSVYHYEYDEKGNIISEDFSKGENSDTTTYTYTYDVDGEILTATKDSGCIKTVYTFEDGKMTEEDFFIYDELKLVQKYQYTDDETTSEESASVATTESETNTYDSSGDYEQHSSDTDSSSSSDDYSEGHAYDKSDPFYSANDIDGDGKLTDEEWQNAMNDAINYYYYKMQEDN